MENTPKTPEKSIPAFSRVKSPVPVLGGSSPIREIRAADRFGELAVGLDSQCPGSPCFRFSSFCQNVSHVDATCCCGTNQEKYVDNGNSENLTESSRRKRKKRDSHMNEKKPIKKISTPKVPLVGEINKSAKSETLELMTPKKGSNERSCYVWKINQELEGSSDLTPEPVRRLFAGYPKVNTTLQSYVENEAKKCARLIQYQNSKQKEIKESDKTVADSKQCVALVVTILENQPKVDSCSNPIVLHQQCEKGLSPVTKKRKEDLPISRTKLISMDPNGHGADVERNIVVKREEGSLVCCSDSVALSHNEYEEDNRGSDGGVSLEEQILSRVKYFIAIMHDIQGNRRFSVWKGSVVDSVVGGFLTQNTTDHSSSSAFLSLAAKFPIQPIADCRTKCIENGATQQNENPANCQIVEKSVDGSQVSCLATKPSKSLLEKNQRKENFKRKKDHNFNFKNLWKMYDKNERKADRTYCPDTVDWEKVRKETLTKLAAAIQTRGQQRRMAERIQAFLDGMVEALGAMELEWLKDVPPDKAKEYLMNVFGLGLKSVDCISLLSLHHPAFPVDTNVQRVAVRLGWMPSQANELPFHLLREYPSEKTVQKYLWQRLCKLDHSTLFELHYHTITFGKVFCTARNPNCAPCPMKGQCLYYASKEASCRLSLPEPKEEKQEALQASARALVPSSSSSIALNPVAKSLLKDIESIDIEDLGGAFPKGSQKKMTVYELPDDHYVLKEMLQLEEREPDDSCPYLLATWPTGLQEGSSSQSFQDQNLRTVPATILIPCRTATKGSFPLSGTYFQINEVFADQETSERPINVLTERIQNLEKRLVFVGVDLSSIFRDQTLDDIRDCFRRGSVCSRGFDRRTRMPKQLSQRFLVSDMKRKRSVR